MKTNNRMTNQKGMTQYVCLATILLISFGLWLVIPYAQHLAYGRDLSWNYLIVKGIIVSVASLGLYLIATAYGATFVEKNSKPILYIGTVVLLAFTVFEYPLSHIETTVLSRVIAYAYAALPFFEAITLIAMAVCLDDILTKPFELNKIVLILIITLAVMLVNNTLRTIILIYIVCMIISRLKAKKISDKVTAIIVCFIGACLFLLLAYEGFLGLKRLNAEFYNTAYMSWISRETWSSAKWFGTMDNLKLVGGSTTYFSILWMVGFLGIIPSVLIVLVLVYLITCLLKIRGKINASNPIILLALIYISVRVLFSVFTNCGIFFTGFMTPMPLIMDTVAGTLGIYWLLGTCNSAKSK